MKHAIYNLTIGTNLRSLLGGAAGNALANRLTENNGVQVLVLEAGGRCALFSLHTHAVLTSNYSNEGVLASIIPRLFRTLSPDTVSLIRQSRTLRSITNELAIRLELHHSFTIRFQWP